MYTVWTVSRPNLAVSLIHLAVFLSLNLFLKDYKSTHITELIILRAMQNVGGHEIETFPGIPHAVISHDTSRYG